MNCKSCDKLLKSTDKFCSNCGAKIVDNRLSMKGTLEEFVVPFFNWDNNFWRTFFGLFKNPKDVLEAYISGARKKYFQPFSYLILYATIAVIFYKIFPINVEELAIEFSNSLNNNKELPENAPFDPKDFTHRYYEIIYNYVNFIIILSIPFYSFITYLTFYRREKANRHNFSEHLVFNSYIQTNNGYVTILFQFIFLWLLNSPNLMSFFQLLFSISFSTYAFKKLYNLDFKDTLIAFLKFWGILFILFLTLIIIGTLLITLYFILKK